MLGDSFRNAPVTNTFEPASSPWRTGIRLHMDLGPVGQDYIVVSPITLCKERRRAAAS